ncbi:MAG: DUF6273 domain-containing protein [Oscillospiraceae bacterium]|jgi:hypothetical protein|nr:DUF6273 domain-containing protein [Oscillospiraceae bacterium]
MPVSVNIGGTYRNVSDIPLNIDGTYRNADGDVNIDGTWRATHRRTIPLSALPVGSVIRIRVQGGFHEFIIVHKGSPSVLYQGFESGAVVMLRNAQATGGVWGSYGWYAINRGNNYENSVMHNSLNSSYFNMLPEFVRNRIMQIRIPFRPGSGPGTNVNSGANGLQCRLFIPSFREVGGLSTIVVPEDGTRFEYFPAVNEFIQEARRRITQQPNNPSPQPWWLRTPGTWWESDATHFVTFAGTISTQNPSETHAARVTFVLPDTVEVNENGEVIT